MDWTVFASWLGIAIFAMLQSVASIVSQLLIFFWHHIARKVMNAI
jgi:hypothetical protein